mmetsp:Transcript_20578/g.65181  ORF Transcript_20578/g.65181 Transcript_20578/m.65181 type:complete len:137 (+) Transcript_20578:96-506(+)
MAARMIAALLLGCLRASGASGLPAEARPAAARQRTALLQRRAGAGSLRVDGAAEPAALTQVDTTVSRKRGGNYLVRMPGDQETSYEPQAPPYQSGDSTPVASVDNTIPKAPDSDGNPYNAPVWAENTPPPGVSTQP